MKKSIFVVLGLLIIALFLVGCAQEEVSDTELEAELSELSDDELDSAIDTVEAQDTAALAGQAYFKKIPSKFSKVPKSRFLVSAYKVKLDTYKVKLDNVIVKIPEPECTTDSDCSGVQICHEGECEFGTGCCLHIGEDDRCEEMNGWECNTGWFTVGSCDWANNAYNCSH